MKGLQKVFISWVNSKGQKSVEIFEFKNAEDLAWHMALEAEDGFKLKEFVGVNKQLNVTEETLDVLFENAIKYDKAISHCVAEA